MHLFKCFMRNSRCYRGTTTANPVGILWHDTGGGNPEIRRYVQPGPDDPNRAELLAKIGKNVNGNDWNHPNTEQKGVNAFIGKLADGSIGTVQVLPWIYRPWGCGGGVNGSCNGATGGKMWIQFEICDDYYKSKDYFRKCYREAVELTAYLCEKYGIDPNGTVKYGGVTVPTILCHWNAYELGLGSAHGDVLDWFRAMGKEYTMAQVRKDVAAKMKGCEIDLNSDEVRAIVKAEIAKIKFPAPTKGEVLNALGNDKWVETYADLPAWAKPEIKELIEMGALRGTEPSDTLEGTKIKGTVNTMIRPIIVAFRAVKELFVNEKEVAESESN